ncbi:glutaredoxin 3 [Moraxella marmotae]|uniref:glutaredoxin 3 n=1 Tax=Moraxella marmotae TaxID=3344520 RepID=UPI0035D3E35F
MKTVTIYTKPTCPYCIAAKQLLNNKSVAFDEISVYDISQETRQELSVKTNGYRTVPQIFIGETFIGGFDQLNKLNNDGKLDELLA